MATTEVQGELFSETKAPPDTMVVNDRCMIRTQDGHRVVLGSGFVLAQYTVGDRMAEANAMVCLVEQGWADQNDVARSFGCSARTVRRHQRRFEDGGLSALGHGSGYPSGRRRLRASRRKLVHRLKSEGHSNCEIARTLGISETAVRKLLRRMGWKPEAAVKQLLLPLGEASNPNLSASSPTVLHELQAAPSGGSNPNVSAFSAASEEPLPFTLDQDPANRVFDRFLACVGLLDDAAPLFRCGTRVPGAGVLLAVPVLVTSGVLDCAREVYGGIGPAFYGLRTTILGLLLMALLRIKRPEGLKEHPPEDLGRILGLDRAPEVKTLRRKLSRLAAAGRSVQLGHALAERRVALRGAALGFLYVDGHVRVYHGQHRIPKTHVARMRLSMPATTDYWVNDTAGDPLFVVTAEANAGLVKMLPGVLGEVRSLVGERRVTIVFDRGGWSPKLFAKLIADGFDILTYRKGRFPRVAKKQFQEHLAVLDGKEITYTLADQGVHLLEGKLRLRQVTRLSEDGHQTPIITSRRDLTAIEVAYRMFERWREENFFKYMREEFALDVLVDYGVVEDNPTREVPNPAKAEVIAKLKEARAELARLQAQYGREALENREWARPTMRGFKIAKGKLGKAISATMKRISSLEAKRAAMPQRVPIEDVVAGEIVKLAPERKHLTSLLKMVAYQAESDLVRLIAPHYRRVEDEGRTLIQTALEAAASIEPTETELRVTLAPLSSPHRSKAVATLCEELNATQTRFPGTRLVLRYAVAEAAV